MNQKASSIEWIPLTHWAKHHSYPTLGTMRNIMARRKDNGVEEATTMVNGRFYVNPEKFFSWMGRQGNNGGK